MREPRIGGRQLRIVLGAQVQMAQLVVAEASDRGAQCGTLRAFRLRQLRFDHVQLAQLTVARMRP